VAGPDRLRFLGMVSRYVALVSHISMTETEAEEDPACVRRVVNS
jgi:hypothetical protein